MGETNFTIIFALLIQVAIFVATIAGGWKVFSKAGRPGWGIIIPLYNIYLMLKIVGRPGWWLILFLIPIVNIVVGIVVSIDLAKIFGKDAVFGVILLWLIAPVGLLILGFGSAKYVGQSSSSGNPTQQPPQTPQGGTQPPPQGGQMPPQQGGQMPPQQPQQPPQNR